MDIPALPFCHLKLTAPKPKTYEYPAEAKTLGDHIRKKRLDEGLRQQDLAGRLGVSEDTILNWELNRTRPRPTALPAIRDFLGCDSVPAAHTIP